MVLFRKKKVSCESDRTVQLTIIHGNNDTGDIPGKIFDLQSGNNIIGRDPVCEVSGITKALEGSYAVLFNNIKGYPGVRNIANVLSRPDRIAKMFGVDDPKKLKFKCLDAIF